MYAACDNHEETLKLFIEHGADVNAKDNKGQLVTFTPDCSITCIISTV